MKTHTNRPAGARSKRGGVLAAAIALSLAGLIAQPALADHDNDRGGRGRGRGDEHHRVEHRRYPVHRPEPIYYPQQESPGINLFIPLWH